GQYIAKTDLAETSREEYLEDIKMGLEKHKLAVKMEDIKAENENGIEASIGLNGIVLSKMRDILCSNSEILSSSKHFKRAQTSRLSGLMRKSPNSLFALNASKFGLRIIKEEINQL
ncbi:hypothetical protein FBU30_001112, partial [Linnemannia zychae]